MLSFPRSDSKTVVSLLLVLAAALALRLFLLAGPQTQIESDEAVVGLMARHILQGDRPVLYWGQNYMGSLEAYLAAIPIALLGTSTLALKIAPLVVGLLFVALVFITGYRVGGLPAAVISGLYVAVGPAFLDLWSLKARGGYVEVMALGQLLLLLAFDSAKRQSIGPARGALFGLLAGVGLWTNTLIGVYLLPIAVYLALVLRRRVLGWWLLAGIVGVLVGAAPMIFYNLSNNFATAGAMFTADEPLREPLDALDRLFRYSLPVLAGLTQGSSSWDQFGPAYFASVAARRPVTLGLTLLLAILILSQLRGFARLVLGREGREDPKNLLALFLLFLPIAFVLSKFREQVMEPRYLLPIYSAAPVLAAYWVTRPGSGRFQIAPTIMRFVAPLFVIGYLVVNLFSIAALDPKLNLPRSVLESTPENRLALSAYLQSKELDRIYTDYWLGYTLTFESGEQVVSSAISGGYNRYIPYAYLVSVAPDPAFVFVYGSKEEQDWLQRWRDRGVQADKDIVSIYSVYHAARPLEAARP